MLDKYLSYIKLVAVSIALFDFAFDIVGIDLSKRQINFRFERFRALYDIRKIYPSLRRRPQPSLVKVCLLIRNIYFYKVNILYN